MSNIHKDLPDDKLHVCKGQNTANVGTQIVNNEISAQAWEPRLVFPSIIYPTNPSYAPPSETDGDVYLLKRALSRQAITTIAWVSGNIVQYTITGNQDQLDIAVVNDWVEIKSATNPLHNGKFQITVINTGSHYFRIVNPAITSSATNEGSSTATADITNTDWDFANVNDWARYNAALDKWFSLVPTEGTSVWSTAFKLFYVWNSTEWIGNANKMYGNIFDQFYLSDANLAFENVTEIKVFDTPSDANTQVFLYTLLPVSMISMKVRVIAVNMDNGNEYHHGEYSTAWYLDLATNILVEMGTTTSEEKTNFGTGLQVKFENNGVNQFRIYCIGNNSVNIRWKFVMQYFITQI